MIFYEDKYAESLLENGTSTINFFELSVLAKYFRYNGQNNDQIKKSLITFCEKSDSNFNYVLNRKLIKDAITNSSRYSLMNGCDIIITKSEMNTIMSEEDYNKRKILFVLLAVSKYFKYNNKYNSEAFVVRTRLTKILKLAKVNVDKSTRHDIRYTLNKSGKITQHGSVLVINFVDEESEPEIIIDDMDDLISFFPFYCEKCGKKTQKAKRHNYCEECYLDMRRETIKNSVRKHRDAL